MQFYYAEGDGRRGPLPIDQLRAAGIGPDTLVWREGMADWAPASQVSELGQLFEPEPPHFQPPRPGPQVGFPPSGGFGQPHGQTHEPGPTFGGPQPGGYGGQPAGGARFGPGVSAGPGARPFNPIGYGSPPPAEGVPGYGLSVASLVLGILAIPPSLLALCLGWLSLPMAGLAIVFGHVGYRNQKRATGRGNGMAVAGLVCGYLSLVVTVVVWVAVVSIFQTSSQKVQQQIQQQQQQIQQRQQQLNQQNQQNPTQDPNSAPTTAPE